MERETREIRQMEDEVPGMQHEAKKPKRKRRTPEELAVFDAQVHQLVTKTSPAIAQELDTTVFAVNNAIVRIRKRGVDIKSREGSQTARIAKTDTLSTKAAAFAGEYFQGEEHKRATYIDMLPELNMVIRNTEGADITYNQLMVMLRRARKLGENVPSRRGYRKGTESEEKIKRYENLLPLLQDPNLTYQQIQEQENISRATLKRAARFHRQKGLLIRGYGEERGSEL